MPQALSAPGEARVPPGYVKYRRRPAGAEDTGPPEAETPVLLGDRAGLAGGALPISSKTDTASTIAQAKQQIASSSGGFGE